MKEEETKVEPIVNTNINNNKSNPSLSTTLPPTKSPLIAQVMKEKLSELSEKLGETEQTKLINQEFGKFVTEETGDTARQLAKFLEHVLKEESKLAAVLKAINQSIIATPFIILKRSFPKQLPFEDVSGTWKILVKITPKEEVSVVHQVIKKKKILSKNFITKYFFFIFVFCRKWEFQKLIQKKEVTNFVGN